MNVRERNRYEKKNTSRSMDGEGKKYTLYTQNKKFHEIENLYSKRLFCCLCKCCAQEKK